MLILYHYVTYIYREIGLFLNDISIVNIAMDKFYEIIYELMRNLVPTFQNFSQIYLIWYMSKIIRVVIEKAKIRKKIDNGSNILIQNLKDSEL